MKRTTAERIGQYFIENTDHIRGQEDIETGATITRGTRGDTRVATMINHHTDQGVQGTTGRTFFGTVTVVERRAESRRADRRTTQAERREGLTPNPQLDRVQGRLTATRPESASDRDRPNARRIASRYYKGTHVDRQPQHLTLIHSRPSSGLSRPLLNLLYAREAEVLSKPIPQALNHASLLPTNLPWT